MTIYCLYIFDRYVHSSSTRSSLPTKPRHCNCVYYHDWHRAKRPKRANDGGALLPGVSHALSPLPLPSAAAGAGAGSAGAGSGTGSNSGSAPGSASGTPYSSPRNTLVSNSGVLVAFSDGSQSPGPPASTATPPPLPLQPPLPPHVLNQGGAGAGGAASSSAGLPFDEEAKLVYGVILSLRNMVKRLSGRYVRLRLRLLHPFVLGLLFEIIEADRLSLMCPHSCCSSCSWR